MKKLLKGVFILSLFAFLYVSTSGNMTANAESTNLGVSEIIELLISLNIIPEDKAEAAREIAEEKDVERDTMAQCLQVTKNLYLGMSDDSADGEVTKLQKFLMDTGDFDYPKVTGYFGPATEQAVQRWQKRMGVVKQGAPETTGFGVVGPMTRSKMACKYAKQVEVQEKKTERKQEGKETEEEDKDDTTTLTEIAISVDEEKSKVYWEVDGISSRGYKVVWSLEEDPTYPTRDGDKYFHSLTKGEGSRVLHAFDGSGTYYVRVCEYTGGECGLYSNQESMYLSDEDEAEEKEAEEGEVTEITLHEDQENEKVWWETEGYSPKGYKVVWSLEENPTYPTRDGDKYKYFANPDIDHTALEAFDGSGTYYVRVCEYLGGSCGLYSNEVTLDL